MLPSFLFCPLSAPPLSYLYCKYLSTLRLASLFLFSLVCSDLVVSLMCSFWILYTLVTPHIHLGILILFTSSHASSCSSYSHFYVASIFHDMCLHVARLYLSYPNHPFSLISPLTLSDYLLLGLSPSSLVLPFPLPSFLHSPPIFGSHAHSTSTSFPVAANHYRGDVISDVQAAGKPRDQAWRCHHSVPRRLQVLHHHQATQPPLHPGGIHQGHPRQLHTLPKVSGVRVTSKIE